VGNLTFFTSESQLLELFSQCGQVVNLNMGLNNVTHKPAGFCFVEFAMRKQAALAIDLFNKCTVDNKQIRVDWDYGFEAKRQYGRGHGGA
jgi:nuclear cap-binding protein subunit 2